MVEIRGGTAAGNYVVDGESIVTRAVFNADYYYNNHKDVANAFGKDAQALFNHFMEHGIYEWPSGKRGVQRRGI